MSLKDNLFSEDAEEDLQHFLKSEQRKRVLVFPPVNNYRRFLLHQLVQERYEDLQTFSIGQGFARRTVVCYKSDYIGPPKVNGVASPTSNGFGLKSFTMGIENQCTPNSSPEHRNHKAKQTKSAPAYEIYRPPALRRGGSDKSPVAERKSMQTEQNFTDTNANARANRPKRPDRAMYVPRHRRSVPEVESKNVPSQDSPGKPSVEHTPPPPMTRPVVSRNSPAAESQVTVETVSPASRRPLDRHKFKKTENTEDQLTHNEENIVPEKIVDQVICKEANDSLPEQTDQIVLSESTRIDLETEAISKQTDCLSEKMEAEQTVEVTQTTELVDSLDQKQILTAVGEDEQYSENSNEVTEDGMVEQILNKPREEKMDEDAKSDISSDVVSLTSHTQDQTTSENSSTSLDGFDKDDTQKLSDNLTETPTAVLVNDESCLAMDVSNDVKQKLKTTSDTPLSNVEKFEKPVKQTLVSKVLIISTCDENKQETKQKTVKSDSAPEIKPPEKKKVKKVERPKSKPAPPPTQSEPNKKINRDECDWDSLFDDNGDCLDPTLIEELTASVGEVVIEKPKSSYKSFTRPVEVSNDEYGHVIEIYNFPSDFKSSDIAAVFSPFKNGGFTLKWVDDTHCLGVFSSPVVAAEVLASDHPFVKTRPLSEATPLSRSKAQKSSEFLQPYRARPETCAALARRLVTKSLGVKLATARQEREQEKIVLREAKEKKRLANKQREDMWEGIITEKPTS